MFEQELRDIWKNSSEAERIKFDLSQLLVDLNKKMNQIEKDIKKRDRREIIASIIGIIMATYLAYVVPFPISKVACLLSITWFGYVIYKLRSTKNSAIPEDLTLPFRRQLEDQKANMQQQAQLLDTVLYWYVLPPYLVNVIFILGWGDPAAIGWDHFLAGIFSSLTLTGKLTVLAFFSCILWLYCLAQQTCCKS
jgi:hypothetical protein